MYILEKDKNVDFQIPDFCLNLDNRLSQFYYDLYEEEIPKATQTEARYEISEKLAQGGLKEIYKVFDHHSQKFIAMACLQDKYQSSHYESFIREAQLTSLLEHPNIIPVYDISFEKKPFFTMKIIKGNNLSEIIFSNKNCPSLNCLIRYFLDVCKAIEYAHSRGIIHLDLKPENIKIDHLGAVLVHDWGVARRIIIPEGDENKLPVDKVKKEDVIVGTPSYMAQEQFQPNLKIVDERSDIFSLGCILFTILTKKVPFDSNENFLKRKFQEPISIDSSIPSSLNAVVIKALKTDPEKRYQSVYELRKEIERYLDGFPTNAEAADFTRQLFLLVKRNKLRVSFILIILMVFGIMTFSFIRTLSVSEKQTKEALKQSKVSQANTERALKKAKENFELFVNEKQERVSENALTSSSLNKTEIVPDKSSYSIALEQLNAGLKVSPENKNIYDRKVMLHLFYENFSEALDDFKKSNKKPFLNDALKVVKEYKDSWTNGNKLSGKVFFSFIRKLQESKNKWIANSIITSRVNKMTGKENHLFFMKELFKELNQNQKGWKWNFKTDDGIIYTFFSLSGLNKIHTLIPLSGKKISYLDLSDIDDIYLEDLANLYVKKINFTNSRLHKISYLQRIKGLEEIIITKDQLSKEEKNFIDFVNIQEID